MNIDDVIRSVEKERPDLAEKLRALASTASGDSAKLNIDVHFRLEKFEGDVTPDSKPFEIIEGGSVGGVDLPTVIKTF